MSTTDKSRTITLTGRPPVRITDSQWPLVASASRKTHDGGEVESQANRTSSWFLGVRREVNLGRWIVYGTYAHESRYRNEPNAYERFGQILPASTSVEDVCQKLLRLTLPAGTVEVFKSLISECIGDFPAEDISEPAGVAADPLGNQRLWAICQAITALNDRLMQEVRRQENRLLIDDFERACSFVVAINDAATAEEIFRLCEERACGVPLTDGKQIAVSVEA